LTVQEIKTEEKLILSDHSIVVYNDVVYAFGGQDQEMTGGSCGLWRLDLNASNF